MQDEDGQVTSRSASARWTAVAALAAFVVGLLVFGVLCRKLPVIPDPDSYYHLAVGRMYAQHGLLDTLPWARMSVLHEGFGDKEILFHLLLAPFTSGQGAVGGRYALAFLNALVLAALAALSVRALGPWGLVVPLLVYLGSEDFDLRVVRLRPEIVSLLGFLAAAWCAGRGRYRWLGVVAFAYTLAYTAFHALVGLCFAWFLFEGYFRRRWPAMLVAYPLLGAGLGLILHPHFPYNLVVWKIQSVDFFLHKGELNVGTEIESQSADQLLLRNLVLVVGLLVLVFSSRRRDGDDASGDERLADVFLVAAALFGVLYFLSLRFAIYAVPFAALAVAYALRRRGLRPGPWTFLPGRGVRIPLALCLAAVLGVGSWRAWERLSPLYVVQKPVSFEADWAALGRAMPPGAQVAAEWGSTHLYMYWAPQAAYLNVLDPVFMALPYPGPYRVLREVFEGREPDLPWALRQELVSDYVVVSRFHPAPQMLERFGSDPRFETLYEGLTYLYRVVPGKNDGFLLDWRILPRGEALPVAAETDVSSWPAWPRSEDPAVAALEGFVDANRVDENSPCLALVSEVESGGGAAVFELAPYGPTAVWIDQDLAVSTKSAQKAFLGHGTEFVARLEPGRHRVTAVTCRVPPEKAGSPSYSGFYLRRREGPSWE